MKEQAEITYPVDLSDKQLISLLYPPAQNKDTFPEPDMENVFYEMKKKGVTLMLLWEEYKEVYPEGVMYTQFCERYRNFKKACRLTMHIEHKAGQEMQIDWAGQVLHYIDTATGELKTAFIFVAVLPASAYPFVYAYPDKKLASYIDAHIRAFEYFGGVPRVLIPVFCKLKFLTFAIIFPQAPVGNFYPPFERIGQLFCINLSSHSFTSN